MTNRRTLAIVAVLMAATLVLGTLATVAATQTAFAVPQKKPLGQDGSKKKTRDSGELQRI
jgi:Spy/CpxP family protein refolding chaperone